MEDYKIGMGKRLKEKRKLLNFTQEQMAEKLNVSVKHYGGVERGIAGLSVENLILVSDILGVDLDYLIKGEEKQDTSIPHRIKEIYLDCPEDKRQHILEILEIIYKL